MCHSIVMSISRVFAQHAQKPRILPQHCVIDGCWQMLVILHWGGRGRGGQKFDVILNYIVYSSPCEIYATVFWKTEVSYSVPCFIFDTSWRKWHLETDVLTSDIIQNSLMFSECSIFIYSMGYSFIYIFLFDWGNKIMKETFFLVKV